MSRIGRKPIAIPKGVKFKIEDGSLFAGAIVNAVADAVAARETIPPARAGWART